MGTSVQTNNSPAGVESGSALSLFPGYLSPSVRRRNTTYKNPQLVAQHCFVASFGRCFAFFTLLDQLDPQQKHLLRVSRGHCVVFLGKTLYSHSASLHPGV